MKTITRLYILQVLLIGTIIIFLVIIKINEDKRYVLFLKSTQDYNERMVDNVLKIDREVFMRPLHDNSEWDETVNYIRNPSEEFELECLNTLLSTFFFNHIWVFDQHGNQVYYVNDSNSLNLDTVVHTDQIKQLFKPESPLCHFYLNIAGELIEITGATIVPTIDTKHESPAEGYLLFARNWNGPLIRQLEELTGAGIQVVTADSKQNQYIFKDSTTVDYNLYDAKSGIVAKLVFAFPITYLQEWKKDTSVLTFINIFIGLSVILIIGFFTQKWLVIPLKYLIKTLDTGEPQHLKPLKSSNNEFGKMAQLIEKSFILNAELQEEITHRLKAEKVLASMKDKAEEADRLKTSFLSNMSHEIRTPMNSIIGFIQLLEQEDCTDDEFKQYISIISNSGKHLLGIINDILDIARIESGQILLKPAHIDLNNLLDQLLFSFTYEKQRLGRNDVVIELKKGIPEKESHIYCDSVRLEQILNNLLSNAMKFTIKGKITFGYSCDKENLLFFVQDTGFGIATQNLENIFERFRQEEESHTRKTGGTGLGLPISKGLVELMDGKLWVTSEKGIGSSFYFTLPNVIRHDPMPVEKSPAIKELSLNLSGKTILIAEDAPENIELIRIMLKATHVSILVASNGQIAVNLCQEDPSIDLVLMDMQMPVMNGYDATREIKKNRPDLPVIALTAYVFDKDKKNCKEAGCDDFLSKPVYKLDLLQKLNQCISP